jgi:hypothetical protein
MGRISRLRLKRQSNGKKREEEGITPGELAVLGGAPLPDDGPRPGKEKDGTQKVPKVR